MIVRFAEVTDLSAYGKFMVMRMDREELATRSAMPDANNAPLLSYGGSRRFNFHTTMVVDLQRGTGAAWTLKPEDMKAYQQENLSGIDRLVCPMYLPFVRWLHEQGTWAEGRGDLFQIPAYLELNLF